jgi:hypothetical protein
VCVLLSQARALTVHEQDAIDNYSVYHKINKCAVSLDMVEASPRLRLPRFSMMPNIGSGCGRCRCSDRGRCNGRGRGNGRDCNRGHGSGRCRNRRLRPRQWKLRSHILHNPIPECISGPEGLAFWAFQAEDLGSRSAFSQRFNRALAKDSQAMLMWKDLNDDLKLKFKASWGIQCTCW